MAPSLPDPRGQTATVIYRTENRSGKREVTTDSATGA
jgi:hypothetical protein